MNRFVRHLGFLGLLAVFAGGCSATFTERNEYVLVHSMSIVPTTVPESDLAQAPVIGVATFSKPIYARLSPRGIASDAADASDLDQ